MDKLSVRNKLLRAKDLRKVLANLMAKGVKVKTERDKGGDYWTTVYLQDNQVLGFSWAIGRDEYDDKECHIWKVVY